MDMQKIFSRMSAIVLLAGLSVSAAAQGVVRISMSFVDEAGIGAPAGEVVVSESKYGLVFTPALAGLPAGLHGFHVHQNASCAAKDKDGRSVPALAAGGHYDPEGAGQHGFPWGPGHLGDLPPLFVAADGQAAQPVLAPRLSWADLSGRSLMIHAGGDNHADHPAALGGGGMRVVCGVVLSSQAGDTRPPAALGRHGAAGLPSPAR